MQTTKFTAPDIVCGGCANAVKKAVGAVPGVSDVSVDVERKSVAVVHAESVTLAAILSRLDEAGYPTTRTIEAEY